MPDETFYSCSDVARLIGVDPRTVARWCREQKLRSIRIKVGKRAVYKIRPEDLADFARKYVSGDW